MMSQFCLVISSSTPADVCVCDRACLCVHLCTSTLYVCILILYITCLPVACLPEWPVCSLMCEWVCGLGFVCMLAYVYLSVTP